MNHTIPTRISRSWLYPRLRVRAFSKGSRMRFANAN